MVGELTGNVVDALMPLDVCVCMCVHMCCLLKFSVVTVSKCFLSVGFGRFCRKKPRFLVRFRFS